MSQAHIPAHGRGGSTAARTSRRRRATATCVVGLMLAAVALVAATADTSLRAPIALDAQTPGAQRLESSAPGTATGPTAKSTAAAPASGRKKASKATSAGRSAPIAAQATAMPNRAGTSKGTTGRAGTPGAPGTSPRPGTSRAGCSVTSMLVSSCGPWLGLAPQTYSPLRESTALAIDEQFSNASFSMLHEYHDNGSLFPNAASIALAEQPGANRVLVENWKPATNMTWAQVAQGRADSRIDAEAAYLKSHFDYPFLLTIWHEPEDNIRTAAGSGMTVADYVAMYRHVILRLRADGASKFKSVMNFMGYSKWYPITDALYPGDDVVDWIAWDPYMHSPSGASGHDFASLVNRPKGSFPGMYDWAVENHPGKPVMLDEWGAFNDGPDPTGQADFFNSVTAQIGRFPQLKALNYFDMNTKWVRGPGTSPDDSPSALAAWRNLVSAPVFNGVVPDYDNGTIVDLR